MPNRLTTQLHHLHAVVQDSNKKHVGPLLLLIIGRTKCLTIELPVFVLDSLKFVACQIFVLRFLLA